MTLIRLNKHISALGFASRREADKLIVNGEVMVNGKVVTEMGIKVDPDKDKVEIHGNAMKRRENFIYIALNKPKGYVCSMRATAQDPKIVTDLIDIGQRIYPVGRLDKDTTGLLLLTNDGTFVNAIIHPSSESEKEYEVTFSVQIPMGALRKLETGVKLQGEKTLPTKVNKIGPAKIRIILKEGKNRQVRRICQKVGYPVKTLKRVRIKNVHLGELPIGRWRRLSKDEVNQLKNYKH